jgi:hypothetical protein
MLSFKLIPEKMDGTAVSGKGTLSPTPPDASSLKIVDEQIEQVLSDVWLNSMHLKTLTLSISSAQPVLLILSIIKKLKVQQIH